MRILFITHYFAPDSGAAAVRLTRLARLLAARGHDVTVLATMPHYPQGQIKAGYRNRFTIHEEREGFQIVRAWLWTTPSQRLSRRLISQNTFMLSALLRGLFIPRPDVVFVEGQPMFTGFAGGILSRLKRVPYVVNISDFWPEHLLSVGVLRDDQRIYRLVKWLMDRLYRGAASQVALSPGIAHNVSARVGPQANVHMIRNAVDLQRFKPGLDTADFRRKYELGERRLIAFVGTFATQYDFDTLLDALLPFKDRDDVSLAIIGQGSQATSVRARLKDAGLTTLKWVHWISHDEMPLAWNACHITIWAMRAADLFHGTIPAKLYEALACGVPVAAAMDGNGTDMLKAAGGGLAVAPGDVAGLQAAIAQLMDDDAFHAACSVAGRAYAEAHFDPETVAAKYEAVLAEAIR